MPTELRQVFEDAEGRTGDGFLRDVAEDDYVRMLRDAHWADVDDPEDDVVIPSDVANA